VETRESEAAALRTTEIVLGVLRDLDDRDTAIDNLVAAIEHDRAQLVASFICASAATRYG
jgi:hypothetical protein